ncbi:MAG: hypothetical protein PHE67_08240 [Campylobacterales bacterium]|nr:hypothetical protein [Campylobacterales bacterium]
MAESINIITSVKVSQSPIFSAKLKDYFCILDNAYNVYFLHPDTYRVVNTMCFAKEATPLHRHSKVMSVSWSNDFCIALEGSPKINIVSLASGKFVKKATLAWHESQIECSAFSPNGDLFASGGADGRVILYDTKSYEIRVMLERRGDYISQISFSDDSTLVCASSFDKITMIYDIDRAKPHCAFELDDTVERSLFFDGGSKLFFVTRGGSCGIYDLQDKKQISLMHHFTNWPISIKKTDDEKFAIVGTKGERLYVIRLEGNSVALNVKLENPSGVSSMEIRKGKLSLGFSDGFIDVIDFNHGIDELETYLKLGDYQRAAAMLKKNCFLVIYPTLFEKFEQGWREVLPKALAMITKNMVDSAYRIAKPFLDDEKRAKEFEFYISQKNEVAQFLDALETKEFAKAYALTKSSQYLTKLSAYKNLEDYWSRCFAQAKKLLAEDAGLNRGKAQELLKPFAQVEDKKNAIMNLLTNSVKFKEAELHIKAKNFKAYFSLCDKYPFLKDTDIYKKTLMLAESILEKIMAFEKENKLIEAISATETLKGFTPYEKAANERISFIKTKQQFMDSFAGRKDSPYLVRAYELAVKCEVLQTTKEFHVMYDEFKTTLSSIESNVHTMKPYQVLAAFGAYTRVDYWRGKISQMMRISYLDEIKTRYQQKDQNIKKGIDTFTSLFGKDVEMENFCKTIGLGEFYDTLKDVRMPTIEYPPTLF